MKIVIRAVLSRYEITPATSASEPTGRRSITFSPRGGATVVLRARAPVARHEPVAQTLSAA